MKIGVLGAGRIGTTLGVELSSAGASVTLVDRATLPEPSRLSLIDPSGRRLHPGADLVCTTDPAALGDVDLCLLTVDARATDAAARTLAEALRPDARVVSFQNGLRNLERLDAHLGPGRAVGGMVGFNVVRVSDAVVRKTTRAPLAAGDPADPRMKALAGRFARAGERLRLTDHIVDLLAGKLLLNLNNGLCAVTGATIVESIRSRALRRSFAWLIHEGDRVLRADGMRPRAVVGLSPRALTRVLPLPDAIVLGLGRATAGIDAAARSSTLQDLLAGRPTEIDELGGEIVRRARDLGLSAPLNAEIVALVHELEGGPTPPRFLGPEALEARLAVSRGA